MIIVRQLVSKSLSPWYGLSHRSEKPVFSPWILTGIHAPNTMTIMYGPYRHRRHVRAFDHASIAVNNRTGILRDSLHILYFARKSPQTAGPSPMDSPDIKEQILQIKIKVRSIGFFTHFIITWLKVLRSPDLHQCTPPRSNNKYYKEKAKSEDPDSLRILLISCERPQTVAPWPMYSPCIIEEIIKNHQVRTYGLVSPGTQVRRPPQLHQPTAWTWLRQCPRKKIKSGPETNHLVGKQSEPL